MTIAATSPDLSALVAQITQTGNVSGTTPAATVAGTSQACEPQGRSDGALDAVQQALAQIGVTSPTTTSSSAGSTDPTQALQSFLQSLFGALQAQAQGGSSATQTGTPSSDQSSGGSAQPIVGGHPHHHGGHGGMGAALQNLIQQLAAATTDSSAATPSAASGSGASGTALANLQQSFQNLVSATGTSGSSATLGNFLTTLASDLPSHAHLGNIVSTQA